MLIFIGKCFVVLLLLGSLAFTLGFSMIIEDEDEMPKWVFWMYILGIIITIIL